MNKSPAILNVLLEGIPIEIQGKQYCLDSEYNFCEKRGDLLLKVNFGDFSIKNYINFIETMSADEFYLAMATRVLNNL